MEAILKIEEGTFCPDIVTYRPYSSSHECEGFIITTDAQEIKLGITKDRLCCESFGYFMSEDDPSEFVGSHLLDVSITDDKLRSHQLVNFEGVAMFVNVETDRGLLQFVAYNEHNGYYGHDACVVSNQLNHAVLL